MGGEKKIGQKISEFDQHKNVCHQCRNLFNFVRTTNINGTN